MELKPIKRIQFFLCIPAILLAGRSIHVQAAGTEYPVIYDDMTSSEEPYLILTEEEKTYTVLPGDSLWKIACKLWGDGTCYSTLAADNQDVLTDPGLIYPGMTLKASRKGYMIRKEAKYGGIQMGKYSMDMPYGWTVGITQSGDASANFVMSGEGVIACLIQDKEKQISASVGDWKQCRKKILDYVAQNYPKQVSDLQFEHYLMENQEDGTGEVYLYSFTWHISPEEYPGLTPRVCVGLKLTDHIQAEFIGYAFDYDIQGCVRYVTATFEEHFDADNSKNFTVNDSAMSIQPVTEWELKGMFNSFAYVDELFTSTLNRALGIETKEQTPREKAIDRMSSMTGN